MKINETPADASQRVFDRLSSVNTAINVQSGSFNSTVMPNERRININFKSNNTSEVTEEKTKVFIKFA